MCRVITTVEGTVRYKRVPQTHQFISRKEKKKSKGIQLVSTKYMKIWKVLQTKIIINMKRVPQTHQFISRKERKMSKWYKSKCVQLVNKEEIVK